MRLLDLKWKSSSSSMPNWIDNKGRELLVEREEKKRQPKWWMMSENEKRRREEERSCVCVDNGGMIIQGDEDELVTIMRLVWDTEARWRRRRRRRHQRRRRRRRTEPMIMVIQGGEVVVVMMTLEVEHEDRRRVAIRDGAPLAAGTANVSSVPSLQEAKEETRARTREEVRQLAYHLDGLGKQEQGEKAIAWGVQQCPLSIVSFSASLSPKHWLLWPLSHACHYWEILVVK